MGTAVGIGVVVAILVLLPLGAVWWARRWRDPPPEKWGVQPVGPLDPGVVEYRLRKQYGLRDEKSWSAVRRAAIRGEAAPAGLRAPAAEYALARAEALEAQLRGPAGRAAWVFPAMTAAVVGGAVLAAVFLDSEVGFLYALYWVAFSARYNPWALRRHLARARAAVEANRG